MQANISEQLLTPQQASSFLGVSTQTLAIWRCNKRYDLRYVKVGRYVRYRHCDLMTFIEGRTVSVEGHTP
ncbi:helix-turn-helix domain-containing protein [Saccharospirillum alexandrii]|uniref:helix-turn-helix domain-containing protein n=1 Tax=Saccharospirillum alexandrii TaxID=2448477 RepID=UPI0015F2BC0E|nr:helix-turn-helix domain-containing protein [Saccharospirillum alexandrii]